MKRKQFLRSLPFIAVGLTTATVAAPTAWDKLRTLLREITARPTRYAGPRNWSYAKTWQIDEPLTDAQMEYYMSQIKCMSDDMKLCAKADLGLTAKALRPKTPAVKAAIDFYRLDVGRWTT